LFYLNRKKKFLQIYFYAKIELWDLRHPTIHPTILGMPRQITQLVNGEIYHVVTRAVGDAEIFLDENDYYRGVFSIYEFNNANPVEIWRRRRDRIIEKKNEKIVGSPTSHNLCDIREKFVEVLAFAFMPNHIHLLLRQLKDDGISNFMRKVGGGYANYFNKKYKRKGHLFNQFRAVHIKNDNQLRVVFVYVHSNPLSLVEPGWKENGIKNNKRALKFLQKYKWSSFRDYIGTKNFKSVTNRDFILGIMNGEGGCLKAVDDWIDNKKDVFNFGFKERTFE